MNEPHASPSTSSERRLLIGILLLGLLLRLFRLGTYAYWHDEVHNLIKSENLWAVLSRGEYVSNHPPLFTTLAAGWRALGLGANEWTMRALPLVLGMSGIVAIFFVGKRLLGPRVALIAAFLLAISPFHILHSQDLKAYVLLPVTGTLMTYCLWRASEKNRPGLWALYALSATIACYSESFCAFLLIGVNVWFLCQLRGRWDRLPGWFLANALGVGLFLPYMPVLLRRTQVMLLVPGAWWLPKPTPWTVAFYLKTLAFGYCALNPLFKVALVLFCILALVGAALALRRTPRCGLLLLCWFAIPVALAYAMSHVTGSVFLYRALLPFAIPFYLLIAIAVAAVPARAPRYGALALLAATAVIPLWQHYHRNLSPMELPHRPAVHPPCDYDKAAEHIAEHWQDGDVVVHTSASSWLPLYWYGLRDYPQFSAGVNANYIRSIQAGNPPTTADPRLEGYFVRPVQSAVEGARRVWLVFSGWERLHLSGNPSAVWYWMDSHFTEVDHTRLEGLEVLLYDARKDAEAPRVRMRNRDDGVSAEISFAASDAGDVYLKYAPDAELIPAALEQRQGALVLAFEDGGEPEPKGTVTFSASNRSDRTVRCSLACLASETVLDAASLMDTDVESGVWRVQHQYNPEPPPKAYEIPVATARFDAGETPQAEMHELQGRVSLPPGTYATSVYVLGTPGAAQQGRAQLRVSAYDTVILDKTMWEAIEPFAWRWRPGAEVTVDATNGHSIVRIAASPTPECETSHADIAYIAFRRLPEAAGTDIDRARPSDWPGHTTLQPGETKDWSLQLDPNTRRLDVWAYEHEKRGNSYRIFQVFPRE